MNNPWIILLQLSACFIGLFVFAELLYHFAKIKAEHTRKIVHIGSGVLTMLFPIYLDSALYVLIICTAFLVLLLISKVYEFLPSINKINRTSVGSYLYPVVVVITFVYYDAQPSVGADFGRLLYFYLPILIMSISDPVAALAGQRFGKVKDKKTFAGSLGFFFSSVIISLLLFSYFNKYDGSLAYIALNALGISLFTVIAERYSKYGMDNLTIPLAAIAFLWILENMAPW